MKKLVFGIILFIISAFISMNYAEKNRNYLLVNNTTNQEVNTSKLFNQFEREVAEVKEDEKLAFIDENYYIYERYFGSLLSENLENPKEILAYRENIEKLDSLAKELKEKYQ